MSTAFELAAQSIMADSNFAQDAEYRPMGWTQDIGGSVPISCRAAKITNVMNQPGFYESNAATDRIYYKLLRSQISAPRRGDVLSIGSVDYILDGAVADMSDEYIWTVSVRKT